MANPRVWYGLQATVVAFWLLVAVVGLMGFHVPGLVAVAVIIFAAHVIEIPLAINKLRNKGVPTPKVIYKTLVFGFTWWMPLSKGYTAE